MNACGRNAITMTKKKQLRIETLKNDYVQREVEFDAAMDEAVQIADLAERILQLEKIKQDINSEFNNFELPKGSESAFKKIEEKVTGFNSGLYFVAVFPPVSIVTLAAMGGAGLKDAATSSRRKKLSAEADGHLQRMKTQGDRVSVLIKESKREQIDAAVEQADLIADPAKKILQLAEIRENAVVTPVQFAQISDRIDTVVENNLRKLALSPLLADVQAVRGIKEKFSEAAMQFIKDSIPAEAKPKRSLQKEIRTSTNALPG
jgi:hypothetical protein